MIRPHGKPLPAKCHVQRQTAGRYATNLGNVVVPEGHDRTVTELFFNLLYRVFQRLVVRQ